MSKYTIMAGLTNRRKNAEDLCEKIKQLGYSPAVIPLIHNTYAVKVIETANEAKAREARDRINKELGINAGLKIKD